MKAIINKDQLDSILSREDPKWQEIVYAQTGVLTKFNKSNDGNCYIDFISSCGYIDADNDAVFTYCNGRYLSDYCHISSISDLVEFILNTESYSECLKDISLGSFTKSELFWNIYSQILRPTENLHNNCDEFILKSIRNEADGDITISLDFIRFDEVNIYMDNSDCSSLDKVLSYVLQEIKDICGDAEDHFVENYKIYHDYAVTPPSSYNELRNYIERYRTLYKYAIVSEYVKEDL